MWVVRESLFKELTFKLKPDCQEVTAKNILTKENCKNKGSARWRKERKGLRLNAINTGPNIHGAGLCHFHQNSSISCVQTQLTAEFPPHGLQNGSRMGNLV